jgi:MarR family transcriptional regulator for hemolysin
LSLDLKRQLVAQLVESSRLLRNYIDHRAKSRGTTRAQWIVLFRLRQQQGLSQVDLADVLELQPISLVRLLDRLVEHGLLERRHDPRDRRANRLFLTASGRQLVDDLDGLRDSIASDARRNIPNNAIETSLQRLPRHQGADQGPGPSLPAASRPGRRAVRNPQHARGAFRNFAHN